MPPEPENLDFTPGYLQLLQSGELLRRVEYLENLLADCVCCPHNCHVNRAAGDLGKCYSSSLPIVSAYTLHFGEEPALTGTKGVGNIFFGNCNLRCCFCQNYEISQNRVAEKQHEISVEKLAEIMLELQEKGCHQIGLVSPTHFVPPIVRAVYIAAQNGLHLPLIYNSNGYDSIEVLKLLDGIIDIYLPDFKYGTNEAGEQYSGAEEYFDAARVAMREMYRQVGSALKYKDGAVVKGMIIRHLVLPNDLADSEEVLAFISRELSQKIHVSLMAQYYPVHKATKMILLDRPLREREYTRVIELLGKYDLQNGWVQEFESKDSYRPDFLNSRNDPFHNNNSQE